MARATRLRNVWTIELLEPRQDDCILEVGFGPGALVQALSASVTEGLIVGVDASPVMLRQAYKRNEGAIQDGRVQLHGGSAQALPFEDEFFDKALSANSVQIWPDKVAGITEMRRVLKPGGRIAIVLQPVWAKTDDEVKEIGAGLVDLLTTTNFRETRLEFKPMKPIASVCALGIK